MTNVESLNQLLADSVGRVCGGTQGRFQWIWAPDLHPFWRERMGKVWVVCGWQKSRFSEAEWLQHYGDRYPYPANGMWHPHTETQLAYGREPSMEVTQEIIFAIKEQMSKTFADHLCGSRNELKEEREQVDHEYSDLVRDTLPAFNDWYLGKRSGSVSFGGV